MSISFKRGYIKLNEALCTLLEVKAGDHVGIGKNKPEDGDEDQSEPWYIYKIDDETGFPLRAHAKSKSLTFDSQHICTMLSEAVDYEHNSGRCSVSIFPQAIEDFDYPFHEIELMYLQFIKFSNNHI